MDKYIKWGLKWGLLVCIIASGVSWTAISIAIASLSSFFYGLAVFVVIGHAFCVYLLLADIWQEYEAGPASGFIRNVVITTLEVLKKMEEGDVARK
jgi:hypothetical protein